MKRTKDRMTARKIRKDQLEQLSAGIKLTIIYLIADHIKEYAELFGAERNKHPELAAFYDGYDPDELYRRTIRLIGSAAIPSRIFAANQGRDPS